MHKAGCVRHFRSVCRLIGTVQSQMEMEILELLLQLTEIVEIKHLVESSSTIEIMHLAVSDIQRPRHVHDLRT